MVDLTAWRAANNFTQEALAKQLGVTRQTVIRWEKSPTGQPADLAQRVLAIAARPTKQKKPDIVSSKTHPDLYIEAKSSNYGKVYGLHAFHPRKAMETHELEPWYVPGTTQLLAAILDDPTYVARATAIRAAMGLQPPRLSQEEWEAKAAAGASFAELFPKAKKPVDNSN